MELHTKTTTIYLEKKVYIHLSFKFGYRNIDINISTDTNKNGFHSKEKLMNIKFENATDFF